jgi:hypothetical protein
MLRRLIAPLVFAVLAASSGTVRAQNAFPAPLPGEQATPPLGTLPMPAGGPPLPTAAPSWSPPPSGDPSQACMKDFLPLREEAMRRGRLIREASERHASPGESCKLLGAFGKAELQMMNYVRAKTAACGIPANFLDQLEAGHKKTADMMTRVCASADPVPTGTISLVPATKRWPEGTVNSDFGDPAFKQR